MNDSKDDVGTVVFESELLLDVIFPYLEPLYIFRLVITVDVGLRDTLLKNMVLFSLRKMARLSFISKFSLSEVVGKVRDLVEDVKVGEAGDVEVVGDMGKVGVLG